MSNKIPAKTRFLFLGTSDADKTVVCITQIGTSESRNDINADSFCGNDSFPGTGSSSITCACQIMESPGVNEASYKKIHDWYLSGTALFFKIGRAVREVGNIENSGECFIQQLTSSDDLNAASTFNITLKIDGDMAVDELLSIILSSVATEDATALQDTDVVLYDVVVDADADYNILAASVILNGSFDSDDITAVKLMLNTSAVTSGATTLATVSAGILTGATNTFGAISGVDKTKTHLIIVATISASATVDQTIISDVPVFEFSNTFIYTNTMEDNGGTFTIND